MQHRTTHLKRALAAFITGSLAAGGVTHTLAADPITSSPIKHVIVILQENVSFDHYFATYPFAANITDGEPVFDFDPDTPAVNGLSSGPMATPNNPTVNAAGTGTVQPFRLARSQATTCDMDHNYTDEQAAYHAGQMDLVVQKLSSVAANCASDRSTVMGYYDGNTVTALWNYAQHFAMSDNFFNTTYGPSAPGAINLVAGNTYGVLASDGTAVLGDTKLVNIPGSISRQVSPDSRTSNSSAATATATRPAGPSWATHVRWETIAIR